MGSVVSAINALQGKLDEVKERIAGAVERDTRDTTGAIKGLQGRLVN
jgi:hypothetical protein